MQLVFTADPVHVISTNKATISRWPQRSQVQSNLIISSVPFVAALVLMGCHNDEKKAGPETSSKPPPTPVAQPPKEVPADIKAFLAWAGEAARAVEAGPKATDDHPVLGRITCQHDKAFDDFGWCASSKEGTPRYAGDWLEKEPTVWSVHIMRDPAVAWLDCAGLGETLVRDSQQRQVVGRWCRGTGTTDIWLRHFVGATDSNTQVYVFVRDFPQKDAPATSHRASLYADLMK